MFLRGRRAACPRCGAGGASWGSTPVGRGCASCWTAWGSASLPGRPRGPPGEVSPLRSPWPRASALVCPPPGAPGLGVPGWSVHEGQVLGRSSPFPAPLTVPTTPGPSTLPAGGCGPASWQGRRGQGRQARPARRACGLPTLSVRARPARARCRFSPHPAGRVRSAPDLIWLGSRGDHTERGNAACPNPSLERVVT